MNKIVLAVDGGRSHLRAFAIDTEGNQLAEIRQAGIPAVFSDFNSLADRLGALPEKIAEETGIRVADIGVACCGLAGLDREEDQRELLNLIEKKRLGLPWRIESDARMTLRAANPKDSVAVALLGTGSSFFARDAEGKVWRTGGWGPLLGDWGSGFEIARQAFVAVFEAWDGTGPQTALTQPLLNMAAVETPPDLLKMLYSETFQPSYWARFAPLVLREAEHGDPVSEGIVKTQIEGVVHYLVALVRAARSPDGTEIHFSGGMVERDNAYFARIREGLRERLPKFPSRLCARESYWGAWELGKEILGVDRSGQLTPEGRVLKSE